MMDSVGTRLTTSETTEGIGDLVLERIPAVGDGRIIGTTAASGPQGSTPAAGTSVADDIPALPPPEVLDALDRAARVVGELGRKNVSLSLEHDPGSNSVKVLVNQDGRPTGQELGPTDLVNLLDGHTSVVSPGGGS
jgi:hypothetical protein